MFERSTGKPDGEVKSDFPFWRTLWEYLKPFRRRMMFVMMCSVLSGVGLALQPIIVKYIVDQGLSRPGATPSERFHYAMIFVGIFLTMSIVRVISWMFGYRSLMNMLEGFLFSVRSRFFRHVQNLCFRFHDQVSSGELFNYIMGSPMSSIRDFLMQFSIWVPNQFVSWIIVFTTLVYFDWFMTMILLVTIICIVTVNMRSRKIIRKLSANFMQEESSVSKYVADMLRGCREIKIQAIESDVSDKFDSQIGRIRDKSLDLAIRRQFEGIKPEMLQYLGIALIYAAGAYSCVYRDLSIGKLFAFAGSVNLLMGPIMMAIQLNLVKANAEVGLERIMRILDTESTIGEKPVNVQLKVSEQDRLAREHRIPFAEFRNVSFSYDKSPVLSDVSCRIMHGTSVALVGPSGSGKTTFARLLLRLYEQQKGEILINGKDIREYSPHDLRASFGVVSQDPFLFQASLFDNIRVADPNASPEEIRKAMDLAYITDFVSELPEGDKTEVGENGHSLSGGQRQRVAIARSVLGNPSYFVFDEATSALDNQSERRIQQAMKELGRNHTLIIIAHRLSTIRHVDSILVFQKGRIIQEGTYEHLASTPGLFEDLIKESE
jgi:ABC-type multidrug transport system fused ATPase/permease subunit